MKLSPAFRFLISSLALTTFVWWLRGMQLLSWIPGILVLILGFITVIAFIVFALQELR
ncbi:MAG: hypothetical protein KGQ16_05430 [Cyanobacteria bacterium REEB444]|nr:hypothetical protein [Cyanobacteria bacterium REEB444]